MGTLEYGELLALGDAGEIDTVLCAAPDGQGRLVGKRLTVPAFRSIAVEGGGVHASSFVFAVDIEMIPLELPVSSSENGWVDVRLVPDLPTLRRIPWEPNAAVVLCDTYLMHADELLAVAPRSILRRQVERAEQRSLACKFASELEFFLARVPPSEAFARGYRDLPMTSDYRTDYHLLQGGRDEWFIRQVRNGLTELGVPIESSKPEWGLGQQEVTLDYCDTLEMADRHSLFKFAVKELAARSGLTATFMAKPKIDEVGSSCHLHVSLWSTDDRPLGWADDAPGGMSPVFGSFVAGQLANVLDFGLLFAPTVNSYKRYQPDQFAGTAIALGDDNRSCAFRLVGEHDSFRVENRVPGADVNPYHAYAATIAAGLAGVESELAAPPIHEGNAWLDPELGIMTTALHASVDRFAVSDLARSAFGDEVYDHLLATARAEVRSFESGCVTDWELRRYYERV